MHAGSDAPALISVAVMTSQSIPSEEEMIQIHNYRMSIEKSFGERSTSVHRSMDETLRLEECERVRCLLAPPLKQHQLPHP